jgi:hypothetical protein
MPIVCSLSSNPSSCSSLDLDSCLPQLRRHWRAQPRTPETCSVGCTRSAVRVPPAAPYAEPLAEHAQSGLTVATEVIESVTPPPSSSIDNLGMEQTATEVVATQVATELPVEATSGGRDVVATSSE